MELYCGTSGFSFKEWKGPFYPDKLPNDRMLGFYAERLPAVEINNTFYRIPKKDVVAGWREQVPPSFRFVVKASRRISHIKRLHDCAEPAAYFFGSIAELGDRLGAVLVQLPPHLRCDVGKLETFLDLVPKGIAIAFEFRHESWQDDAVLAALAAHDAALVVADEDGKPPKTLPAPASWTYLRLRAPDYPPARLRAWHKRLASFERAFVFFKHEDDGTGPKLAERMQKLSGSEP
ncbi:MAG: DUF72 domain-containing protein [Gammaproteobacteria bacterium]|nr:DUF72 domain-containing protein [Gammaproteobacteria bacterium]